MVNEGKTCSCKCGTLPSVFDEDIMKIEKIRTASSDSNFDPAPAYYDAA